MFFLPFSRRLCTTFVWRQNENSTHSKNNKYTEILTLTTLRTQTHTHRSTDNINVRMYEQYNAIRLES